MVRLPRRLQVEPVGQCNLRCQMCPIQFRRDGPPHGPRAFMDFDVFTRLIDEFPDLEELQLQGLGEPMMHPRFFDMVAHAGRRGIRVGTNTNLTLLNARRAELCVTSGLSELHASIDGATAAFAISSRRITRRKSADRARSTQGRFEPCDGDRDSRELSASPQADPGTARLDSCNPIALAARLGN